VNNGAQEIRQGQGESEALPAYWWSKRNNFGDVIGPEILALVTGCKVGWAPASMQGKILGMGSTLNRVQPGDVIWGAGIWSARTLVRPAPGVSLLAFRGKLSAQAYGAHPATLGDPGLLVGLLADAHNVPSSEPRYDVGWVANCQSAVRQPPRCDVAIDITGPWQEVVQALNSCRFVWTASLHAMIACEAFRIPCGYVHAPDIPLFKFQDYLSATGRHPSDIIDGSRLPTPDPEVFDRVTASLLRVAQRIPHAVSRWVNQNPVLSTPPVSDDAQELPKGSPGLAGN